MPSDAVQKQVQTLLTRKAPVSENEVRKIVQAVLQKGEEEVVFLLLQLIQQIRGQQENDLSSPSPTTPSGMIPPYKKETAKSGKSKKKKKAGGQKGHPGTSRARPETIHRQEEHRLDRCPDCGGPLQQCNGKQSVRSRIIEDIPQEIEPEVTEHIIHRDYCPHCKKLVEPKVEAALPNSTIGIRLLVLTAFWHYALGMTLAQILETLNYHLQFRLTKGSMVQQWHRLRLIVLIWYETLAEEIQDSAVLHADETGWRVNGKTYWLWCFTTDQATFYMVDRSRGSPALKQLFQETFDGILVTDFWSAYDAVGWREHQCCLFHLLTELQKVNARNASEEWVAFSKKTKRLIQDALRLRAHEDFSPERYKSRIDRLYERLIYLFSETYTDNDARRIAKRLDKYRDELFVFLTHPEVPPTNNRAEQEIRPAVLMRKVIYGNRSQDGALTQSVLMTVFRTLKRRGHNPIKILTSALQDYIRTGQLPSFPPDLTSKD